MGFKNSKFYSMVAMTCPRCHEGDLFKTKSAYKKGMADMNPRCTHCGEDFGREPGYYYGAAYVSYGLTVALWVAVFVALVTFDALGIISFSFFDDAVLFLVVGISVLLILMPVLYRLSRSMWIHMFVKYRADAVAFNDGKRRAREERRNEKTQEAIH
ncbi:DUF983 domain-containing protein [Cryomorpha ignava]|uniref:DUF983 domain-containing protein n=1 Tax=Cryomorpha ignava TaxID=101383 RepID=A0A7K3WPS7_9FLAO|nr:DUF983 domain-containing protein [Cryomorpha ignava]NEN22892.1 DUF983 domain-containing protein [Cryomorpha ignava]